MAVKILITGANGFIGRHLVAEALRQNMEVYAGVRSTSNRDSLKDPRIHFFPFDMNHPARLREDLKRFQSEMGGFQFVLHNAAITIPMDDHEFVTGNADFTREFARMLMETQHGFRKFVFMSSMAALGPGNPNTMVPIDEKQTPRPITPYGHSKLLAERYLHEIEELPYIILRPTGVYGPGDVKFILRVIGLMKKGIQLSIGPAYSVASYVHTDDLSRLSVHSCLTKIQREDFNVADGHFHSQQEFSNVLREIIGAKTIGVRLPTRLVVGAGYAIHKAGQIINKPVRLTHLKMTELTSPNWKVDITKARQLLNYQPKFDIRKGLKQVVDTMED